MILSSDKSGMLIATCHHFDGYAINTEPRLRMVEALTATSTIGLLLMYLLAQPKLPVVVTSPAEDLTIGIFSGDLYNLFTCFLLLVLWDRVS